MPYRALVLLSQNHIQRHFYILRQTSSALTPQTRSAAWRTTLRTREQDSRVRRYVMYGLPVRTQDSYTFHTCLQHYRLGTTLTDGLVRQELLNSNRMPAGPSATLELPESAVLIRNSWDTITRFLASSSSTELARGFMTFFIVLLVPEPVKTLVTQCSSPPSLLARQLVLGRQHELYRVKSRSYYYDTS
jgi:hypothetical protein